MLPRGNWSSVHDTTGHWGLNWYVEHATAGSADVSSGLCSSVYIVRSVIWLPRRCINLVSLTTRIQGLYGLIWVAPSPGRPRPYELITQDAVELKLMHEAEKRIQHFVIKNHQGRDTTWKLLRMRAEGSEFYCYDSILVNGE